MATVSFLLGVMYFFFSKGELSGASLPFIMNFGLVHVVFSLGRRFVPPPRQKAVIGI